MPPAPSFFVRRSFGAGWLVFVVFRFVVLRGGLLFMFVSFIYPLQAARPMVANFLHRPRHQVFTPFEKLGALCGVQLFTVFIFEFVELCSKFGCIIFVLQLS